MDDEIDDLIAEIRDDCAEINSIASDTPALSANNVNDYILKISEKLLTSGMESLHEAQLNAIRSMDPEAIEAYSSLFKSITKGVETINKINVQQIKNESTEKIKKMDIESKEKIANKQISAGGATGSLGTGNTNILLTNREDFINLVKGMDSKAELPDDDDEDDVIDIAGS